MSPVAGGAVFFCGEGHPASFSRTDPILDKIVIYWYTHQKIEGNRRVLGAIFVKQKKKAAVWR